MRRAETASPLEHLEEPPTIPAETFEARARHALKATILSFVVGHPCVACTDETDPTSAHAVEVALADSIAQATPTPPAPAPPAGSLSVCERPESAYFDSETSAWYVSCQAKADVPKDGYVTQLNADATAVVIERFVSGLDEPKGIRIRDGKLYVSNVNELVTADVGTGTILARTSIIGIDPRVSPNPFLNDVTVNPATGDVYVSDTRNDTLYRFDAEGKSPQLLIQSPLLEAPNGLLIDDRDPLDPHLLIAAIGPGFDPVRGVTAKLGAVLSVALSDLNDLDATIDVSFISQRIGNLDGIERAGDQLIVSDFFAGRVMRLTPTTLPPSFGDGDAEILKQSLARSADLGLDPETGLIVIPETNGGYATSILLEAL